MLRKLSSIYFYVNVISNFCTLTNEYATSAINDFRQKKRKEALRPHKKYSLRTNNAFRLQKTTEMET